MKPAPGIYREIAARLGTPLARLAFTDDVEDYVSAAQSLGMWGVWFQGAEDRRLFSLGFTELGGPLPS